MAQLKCSEQRHPLRKPSIPGNEDLANLWVTILGQVTGRRGGDSEICSACAKRNHQEDGPAEPTLEERITALEAAKISKRPVS